MVVPSPFPSPPTKAMLRERFRAQRHEYVRSLSPDTRGALETQLANALDAEWTAQRVVAGYQPMNDEIDPTDALRLASQAGCITALPAFVDRDSRMTFHPGRAETKGPWGILQPPLDTPAVSPDLLLIPLLAIDRSGNRVGQGKGHYDRALAHLRDSGSIRLIGVGWEMQLVDEPIVPDPWDIPLNAFASPAGLMEFA